MKVWRQLSTFQMQWMVLALAWWPLCLCSEKGWWRGRVMQSGSFIAQTQDAMVTSDKETLYSHFSPKCQSWGFCVLWELIVLWWCPKASPFSQWSYLLNMSLSFHLWEWNKQREHLEAKGPACRASGSHTSVVLLLPPWAHHHQLCTHQLLVCHSNKLLFCRGHSL